MNMEAEGEMCHDSSLLSASGPKESSSKGSESDKLTSTGNSFYYLKGAVDKSVNKLTSKNRVFPHVKEFFEPIYRTDSKHVVELFKSMMDQLKIMINEEIDLQLDSNNVQQLLGELDSVKKEGKTGGKIWRPSGDPQEDLKAHLYETNEKELEHLQKVYTSLLSKNKLLNDSVKRAKHNVESTMQKLDTCCNEWEEAASAIPKTTRQEIVKISLELPYLIKSDV